MSVECLEVKQRKDCSLPYSITKNENWTREKYYRLLTLAIFQADIDNVEFQDN
jgi:hypothetical protein